MDTASSGHPPRGNGKRQCHGEPHERADSDPGVGEPGDHDRTAGDREGGALPCQRRTLRRDTAIDRHSGTSGEQRQGSDKHDDQHAHGQGGRDGRRGQWVAAADRALRDCPPHPTDDCAEPAQHEQ